MSQETIRALEHVRQRLNTLATSLGSLRRDLESDEKLPSWPSIQNSATLLSHNLASLQAILSSSQPALQSAHAYPLPAFPGRTKEDLLGQLLRKKLQPPVEDWIEVGKTLAPPDTKSEPDARTNGSSDDKHGLSAAHIDELWNWAGPEGNRIAREIGEDAFNDFFTIKEREDGPDSVVTGLRRKIWESDDEDEDGDEQDKMDVDEKEDLTAQSYAKRQNLDEHAPLMPLETILRFGVTGMLPANPPPVSLTR